MASELEIQDVPVQRIADVEMKVYAKVLLEVATAGDYEAMCRDTNASSAELERNQISAAQQAASEAYLAKTESQRPTLLLEKRMRIPHPPEMHPIGHAAVLKEQS